jgi:uncharacterized protein (TIRG00374 family)
VPAAPATRRSVGDAAQSSPSFLRRHRRLIALGVFAIAVVGFIYFVLPQISGLSGTLRRLRNADPWWIAVGVVFEALSLGGYTLLFRTVFSCHGVRIGWGESAQITLAGTVATKVFAAAGAGGVALTVWALRASGLSARAITRRMVTFELLLYTVFAGALLVLGVGLRTGVFSGQAPWTLTVIPALIAAGAILLTLSMSAFPARLEQRIERWRRHGGRVRRLLSRLASAPRMVRDATSVGFALIRHREFGVLGAIAYWALDMGALWAALHAFGKPPPLAPVILAYFVGQLANAIPIPGGIGGVEGGTIGALIAFGTPSSLAILGVLAYRLISFWLPTVPGGLAYIRLRRTVARWREAEQGTQAPESAASTSAAT